MTAPLLFAGVAAAILLQLLIGVGAGLWGLRARQGVLSSTEQRFASTKIAAWEGWREFRIARRCFEDPAQTQCSFYLAPADGGAPPSYAPGQFVTVGIEAPASRAGPARHDLRCYSLSDAPDKATYRITVKRSLAPPDRPDLPPGVVSNHLLDFLREGDALRIKAPSGQFLLDPDSSTPAVFLAGGIGVTPILSMLVWSLAHQPGRSLHLFYGVRNKSEHAFKQTLEELARANPCFRLTVFYAAPGVEDLKGIDFQQQGFIDIGAVRRALPSGRHQFYLCGPLAMMGGLVPALTAWGAPASDIHFEAFGPASLTGSLGSAGRSMADLKPRFEIQFRRSGRTLTWTGEDASLLDFAERNNVQVDSGCRTGNCGSCETRLISGEVRYLRNPDHELAPGACLLCVATPASALTLEA